MSVEVKSLVEAIYERYSSSVGGKLDETLCIAASPASSTDTESTSSSSVMCGSPEDIDSSSCDSVLSISTTTTSTLTASETVTPSKPSQQQANTSNPATSKLDKRRKRVFNRTSGAKTNTSNKIMFYLPDAYNNSTPVGATTTTTSARVATAQESVKDVNNNIITSVSLVMSDMNIKQVGDLEKLERVCKNVLELDVSKNQFDDWTEIGKILGSLDKLRLLNLSSNKLHGHELQKVQQEYDDDGAERQQQSADMKDPETSNSEESDTSQSDNQEEKMDIEQVMMPASPINQQPSLIQSHQLTTLILNSCHLSFSTLQSLLSHLPNLAELHLASNQYTSIEFSHTFVHPSLRILYFNNNMLSEWSEVAKLGKAFSNLDQLVLSDNSQLASFSHPENHQLFRNLKLLIANRLSINEWSCLDELKRFPSLKHLRMQHVPLLTSLSDEEKYFLLVAHLHDGVESLNGGRITAEDRDQCERKYIRYFMDSEHRPSRYYELEAKHGKLNKLADVNLDARKKVLVKIKFDKKHYYEKIDVRQTVGDFKKHLEKLIGHPASRFRLFYIDIEACSLAALGPEELKHANRCLYSFNIRDQDEFQIDLKPTPVTSFSGNSGGNGASVNWVLNSPTGHHPHSSSSPSELNSMHHLHIHHYNSHLNNNSFYQYPPVTNRSKQPNSSQSGSTTSKSTSKQLLQQPPGLSSSVSPRPTTKHHKLSNPISKNSHHHNHQQSTTASTK